MPNHMLAKTLKFAWQDMLDNIFEALVVIFMCMHMSIPASVTRVMVSDPPFTLMAAPLTDTAKDKHSTVMFGSEPDRAR